MLKTMSGKWFAQKLLRKIFLVGCAKKLKRCEVDSGKPRSMYGLGSHDIVHYKSLDNSFVPVDSIFWEAKESKTEGKVRHKFMSLGKIKSSSFIR